MVKYDPASYAAKRKHPTRDTYNSVFSDIIKQGYSFIRLSAVNQMRSRMQREQLHWSFTREDGRIRVKPMKE